MTISQPIVSAGKRPLPELTDAPDMRETVTGSSRPMVLEVVTLTPDEGGDAEIRTRLVKTNGFLLQTTAKKLDIKESGEGTRSWKHYELTVLNDPAVNIGDKLRIREKVYKVVKSWDFSQFGFYRFGLTEDFR